MAGVQDTSFWPSRPSPGLWAQKKCPQMISRGSSLHHTLVVHPEERQMSQDPPWAQLCPLSRLPGVHGLSELVATVDVSLCLLQDTQHLLDDGP